MSSTPQTNSPLIAGERVETKRIIKIAKNDWKIPSLSYYGDSAWKTLSGEPAVVVRQLPVFLTGISRFSERL